MKLFRSSILATLLSCYAFSAQAAEWTPFQLSLVNPVQLFSEETNVQGLRVNLIYGVNKDVKGVDLGVVNRTTGTTQGVQAGAFPYGGVNLTEKLNGVQFGGFFGGINRAGGEVNGVQISGIIGGINIAGDVHGAQISGTYLGINIAKDVQGVQLTTIYNQADAMEGVQVGLINVCTKMRGVQIGLVNVIKESPLQFFPILNASF